MHHTMMCALLHAESVAHCWAPGVPYLWQGACATEAESSQPPACFLCHATDARGSAATRQTGGVSSTAPASEPELTSTHLADLQQLWTSITVGDPLEHMKFVLAMSERYMNLMANITNTKCSTWRNIYINSL